jgi:hypothetical protein
MMSSEDYLNKPKDIETKINIAKLSIQRYEMDLVFVVKSEEYDSIINKINKEKEILETYKEKYPEYFI